MINLLLAVPISVVLSAYYISFTQIDPVAEIYMDQFISEVGVEPVNKIQRIQYVNMQKLCSSTFKAKILGSTYCDRAKDNKLLGVAYMLPTFIWKKINNMAIDIDVRLRYDEQLLVHELTHALYNIPHTGQPGGPTDSVIMQALREDTLPRSKLKVEKQKLINFIRSKYGQRK